MTIMCQFNHICAFSIWSCFIQYKVIILLYEWQQLDTQVTCTFCLNSMFCECGGKMEGP